MIPNIIEISKLTNEDLVSRIKALEQDASDAEEEMCRAEEELQPLYAEEDRRKKLGAKNV